MSTKVGLSELTVLAAALAMLVAVMAVPTESHAATRAASHRHRVTTLPYIYGHERNPVPDSGYDWGNPDRGPYPQECGGGSC